MQTAFITGEKLPSVATSSRWSGPLQCSGLCRSVACRILSLRWQPNALPL